MDSFDRFHDRVSQRNFQNMEWNHERG